MLRGLEFARLLHWRRIVDNNGHEALKSRVARQLGQLGQDVGDACLLNKRPAFDGRGDGSKDLAQVRDCLEAARLVLHSFDKRRCAQFKPR